MFLNDARFASDGIAILFLFLTHLNTCSKENFILAISELTRLEIWLDKSIIDYMLRVYGISQWMQGVKIDCIILLFAIASLDHDQYPGMKSRYLAGYTALVHCNLLQLGSILSSAETRQLALGIPNAPPSNTIPNCVLNTTSNPPQNGRPDLQPLQPRTKSSTLACPPARGLPWKCITAMMGEEKYCPGCHFNHPDDFPKLKFYRDVGCPALAKHG